MVFGSERIRSTPPSPEMLSQLPALLFCSAAASALCKCSFLDVANISMLLLALARAGLYAGKTPD